MEYTPFKCPDCKVWWRSETHKCDVPNVTVTVNPPANAERDEKGYWKVKTDWSKHYTCVKCKEPLSKQDMLEQHTRCGSCRSKRNKGYGEYGYKSPNGNA